MLTNGLIKAKLKNISNGRKYVTSIINEQDLNLPFRNEELEYILLYHPENEYKCVNSIEYLVVRLNLQYKTRTLYIKSYNKSEDDISYIICIQSIFNKFDQNKLNLLHIYDALRNAINNHNRLKFLRDNATYNNGYYGICSKCNQYLKACVDHYLISFKYILDNFCSINNIIISEIKIKWVDNVIIIDDIALKDKWSEYHDSVAIYRILCRSCNSSLGSYDYKAEKKLRIS